MPFMFPVAISYFLHMNLSHAKKNETLPIVKRRYDSLWRFFCYSSSNGRSRNFPKITRLEFSSPFSWCTKELLLPKEVILEWKELVFFLDLMFILLIKGFEHIPVRQFLWLKLCIASWKVHYALKLFATGFLCLFFFWQQLIIFPPHITHAQRYSRQTAISSLDSAIVAMQ